MPIARREVLVDIDIEMVDTFMAFVVFVASRAFMRWD